MPPPGTTLEEARTYSAIQLFEQRAWGESWQDSGYVFVREDGSPYHPESISQRFDRLCGRAKPDTASAQAPDVRAFGGSRRRHRNARSGSTAGPRPVHGVRVGTDIVERDYHAWSDDRLVIDTARLDIEQSVQAIVCALRLV